MRVLFLQRQPCIKALKYAVGLRGAIPGLTLGFAYQGRTLSALYGSGDELFDQWSRLPIEADAALAEVVEDFRPDIIHGHNLPDVLTVAVQPLAGGAAVIHDVHDFQSLRKTPYEDGFPDPPDPIAAERAAVEDSDALITVSDVLMEEIRSRYDVPARHTVFPNYALARDLPSLDSLAEPVSKGARALRVVYQGTISIGGGHYDLREIFESIVQAGAELHVFPGREPTPEYHRLADRYSSLTLHKTLPTTTLLATLPQFDVGLAAFNDRLNDAHLATVLPNKGFEYVGCGLPILTLEHAALADWVRTVGVGVVAPGVEHLAETLADLDVGPLAHRCRELRDHVTIEGAIGSITQLYEQLAS